MTFHVVQEWRNDLEQLSYCYAGRVIEDTGVTQLTEDEIKDGLTHLWLSAEDAREKMEACRPKSELGRYIRQRDLYFLKSYMVSKVTQTPDGTP